MVLCAVFGCGTRSVRDKGISMARIPSVITNQGEEMRELSEERRNKWISAISRKHIGLLKRKYTILSGILPIDFLQCDPTGSQEAKIPMIDRIITVCAALTNLSNGIVPLD